MKAKWFLLTGLSIMMLGACSSEDDLTSNPGNKPTIEGEGIMNLNLKFAGSASPRAFEEGEEKESIVNDAYVYYFKSDAGNAFLGCSKAKIISQTGSSNPGSNVERKVETTVPAKIVQALVNKPESSANIIVVLNKHSTLLEGGYADFDAFNAALSEIGDDAGFMMSSSTYQKDAEGIKYFEKITHENIAKVGAGTHPKPVTVYVERLCSKVTLSVGTLSPENGSLPSNAIVDLKNWGLNVKNTKEFPVKKLDTDFTNLTTATWPGADNWNAPDNFRSYWAIDPNYSDNLVSSDFKILNFSDLKTEKGQSEYCLENTFNHAKQRRNETTTAVIYAQYTPQLEGTESKPDAHTTWIAMNNKFYSQETFVGNFLAEQKNIYKKDGNKFVSPTGSDVTFTYTAISVGNSQTIGGTDYKLEGKTETAIYKLKEEALSNPNPTENDFILYETTDWENLNTQFTEYCESAKIYINGYCYYEIPIRHFTDAEVPLAGKEGAIENSVINDASQLGRYGIVRNHSYKLTINKVLNPGKPIKGTEITPEDIPDDKTPEYYMDVTINVLSWAVRLQDVEL